MNNKENKAKVISTIWLDFLGYIFMPFYIFSISLDLIDCFNNIRGWNILKIVALMICIIYSIFTFYYLIKRKKIAYYCLFPFFIISMCTIIFHFANEYNIDNSIYLIVSFVISFICWVIPNYIYLLHRRTIFKEYQLNNIKKCPGCNRIIPVRMKSCGRCGYKE